jgi:hypothetical protein
MKFRDKKGNEIECSVEEYKQLMEEDSGKSVYHRVQYETATKKEPKKEKYVLRKAGYKTRTDKEFKELAFTANRLIRESKETNLQKIINKTGITYAGSSYYRLNKVYKKIFKEFPKDTLEGRNGPAKEKKPDKRINRMAFVHSRAKVLINQDNHLSYQKACEMARSEWNSKVGLGKITPKSIIEKLPYFKTLGKKGNSMIEMILKNVIANQGTMTYLLDGKMMGMESGLEWRAFTEEFILLKKEVAEYFGVEDHFEAGKIDGKFDKIEYKKE